MSRLCPGNRDRYKPIKAEGCLESAQYRTVVTTTSRGAAHAGTARAHRWSTPV